MLELNGIILNDTEKEGEKMDEVIDAHQHGFTVLQLRKDKTIVMSTLIIFIACYFGLFFNNGNLLSSQYIPINCYQNDK